jgi:hypothetical protein
MLAFTGQDYQRDSNQLDTRRVVSACPRGSPFGDMPVTALFRHLQPETTMQPPLAKLNPLSSVPSLGASIRVFCSEAPAMGGVVDMSWDPSALAAPKPTGKWWGPWFVWIAAGGKTPAGDGEWEYDRSQRHLSLWIPWTAGGVSARNLIVGLDGFDFPPRFGSNGSGRLFPPMPIPSTNPWPFLSWRV